MDARAASDEIRNLIDHCAVFFYDKRVCGLSVLPDLLNWRKKFKAIKHYSIPEIQDITSSIESGDPIICQC